MWIKHLIIILAALIFTTNCYAIDISGTVVDAETGQPIEGAVVLVEWVATKGLPGLTHTESTKVIEALTDKDGKFTINDAYSQTPAVTVYKQGYVAWNNKYIFPGYKKRTDFKWESGYVFKLEKFKEEVYKHCDHSRFLYFPIGYAPTYNDALRWEQKKCLEE